MPKITMHPGYASQLARIANLLNEDAERYESTPFQSMLYITEVNLACEGDDKTVAKIKYDADFDSLEIELDSEDW